MILVNLPRRIFHTTSKQGCRKPPATPFIQNPPPAENEISNDTFGTGIDPAALFIVIRFLVRLQQFFLHIRRHFFITGKSHRKSGTSAGNGT